MYSKHSGQLKKKKQKKKRFFGSNFLILVLNRFAMLHNVYKQLKLGHSTESCLWLWVNFHLKDCLILVV